ncbi:myomegalin isoform X5 [Nothobranchius furzeri]|uniref:myomegalin isoform X5 n=1 Tax=Nothobranchius furzeri TaxID=105023 RepID=UPI0039049E06
MKETCRICARELWGNQRRWIFHPGAKLNLQVLLSHALGQELTRDGRGEFTCSKCAFMLDRMYRFDTVIARVEALSLERLQKLLMEKERLRQCIGGLYRRNNLDQNVGPDPPEDTPVVDLSTRDVRYSDLVQDDLTYSMYESWAGKEDPDQHLHQCTRADSGPKARRCRGCAALRVEDSDYEAVCKVPRRAGRRSTSCGPSTSHSTVTLAVEDQKRSSATSEMTAVTFEPPSAGMEAERRTPSPASSEESLDLHTNHKAREEPETEEAPDRRDAHWDNPPSDCSPSGLEVTLSLLRGWEYRPVQPHQGSKLPVLTKARPDFGPSPHLSVPPSFPCESDPHQIIPEVVTSCPEQELQEMEEQWLDDYVQCGPFRSRQQLMDEQPGRYQNAAGQSVGELQKAQDQVRSLQARIRETETRNQVRLSEMELELRSARDEAQQQERVIQNLSDSVNAKETEVSELYGVIRDQNQNLGSLRERVTCSQLQAAPGPSEVLVLQASLFQAQLELQAGQRAQRQAARAQENQNRALERLEKDLQGALQHRRETEKHNQDLQLVLQKVRSALQEKEEQLRQNQEERRREEEVMERTIKELRTSLQTKDRVLENYREMLEDPKQNRDSLLQKLRQRLSDRDRALERAVDEKFRSLEEKEEETRRTRLLLREKERDLERQCCVLSSNQETIASLEALLRGKTLELDRVSDGWRSVQRQQRDAEDRQTRVLKERDAIIEQLQAALLARTQEAQELRCSLLAQVHSAPGHVLEELKVRLQLKDRLFQEVLADRTRQAREHQEQVQDLLRTISSRDQNLQDLATRFGEVLAEQTSRVQELRRQLSPGSGWKPDSELTEEVQTLQEELRLALRREKENQELSRTQMARLDSFSRSLNLKDDTIRDLQRQLVEPSDLTLVERLSQEVEELKGGLVQRDAPGAGGFVSGRDRPGSTQPELGDLSSGDEDEAEKGLKNQLTQNADEESRVPLGGSDLVVVRELVEQKREVERQLRELKEQLEKTGFSSLSQMRKALFDLQAENEDLRHQLTEERQLSEQGVLRGEEGEEEEELDVAAEESWDLQESWDGSSEEKREQKPNQLLLLSTSSQNQDDYPAGELEAGQTSRQQQKSSELQERRTVSEAAGQAQAEQLLTEPAVQQDAEKIQVDLQDLGYETCGRSENEAEREETSSPEFDDLEMCTSLDCGSQWRPSTSTKTTPPRSGRADEVLSLQRLVEDLRSQLTRSQAVMGGLRSRVQSLPNSGEPSAVRKVNWSFQASGGGTEEGERWQFSDGEVLASPCHHQPDKQLQELTSRVDALEDQLRKSGKKTENGDTASWPGKFDSLIQAQARELSLLRQRQREARGICNILTQHLGDTTKAFEELLRANDIDYYMGQSFRDQLAQSSALAQQIVARIRGRDHSEDSDEKTELLAIRLSKELQQKDKVIESLRVKLNHHRRQRSDTPTSCHALSDTSDQSDCISYVSDEHRSTIGDVELCSDVDAASELGLGETRPGAGFSTPHPKPRNGFSFVHQQPASSSGFHPPSFPGFESSLFGGAASGSSLDAGAAMKAGASLLESSPSWEMAYGSRPARVGADLSSGSSGYQSGTTHPGSDLMMEHLREIRSLRQRLEDSIQTNDLLRQQLEEKLGRSAADKGGPTNIYIQGLDSASQRSGDIRFLKEENAGLQTQLEVATREARKGAEHLRKVELDAARWAELSRKLQVEADAHRQEVTQLKQDRLKNQESINRLQHEASVLRQQLQESCSLVHELQNQLQAARSDVTTHTHSAASSHQDPAPGSSLSHHHGRHAVSHVQDLQALQQQLLEGSSLVLKVEASLWSLNASQKPGQPSDSGCVTDLLLDTRTLKRVLQEAESLLRSSWRAAGPPSEQPRQDPILKEELASLHLKLSEQEQALRDTMERLKSSNLTRDSMEKFIISQLSRTRDVLKKAKTNLQVKTQETSCNPPRLLVGVS